MNRSRPIQMVMRTTHHHHLAGTLGRPCDECGDEIPSWGGMVMLKHALWRSITNPEGKGFLCVSCIEGRLGRPIKMTDLLRSGKTVPFSNRLFIMLRHGWTRDFWVDMDTRGRQWKNLSNYKIKLYIP